MPRNLSRTLSGIINKWWLVLGSPRKKSWLQMDVSLASSLEGDSLVFTRMNWADLTSLSLREISQHLSVGSLLRGPEKMVCDLVLVLSVYSAVYSLVNHWDVFPLKELFSFPICKMRWLYLNFYWGKGSLLYRKFWVLLLFCPVACEFLSPCFI